MMFMSNYLHNYVCILHHNGMLSMLCLLLRDYYCLYVVCVCVCPVVERRTGQIAAESRRRYGCRDMVVILGDFNARVSSDFSVRKAVIGPGRA